MPTGQMPPPHVIGATVMYEAALTPGSERTPASTRE
jgi:hypothetical protein